MTSVDERGRPGERGSAMIIAVLVMVILTLLGVSFLLMAETENRIAQNEKWGAQALYFGEGGTRQVKRWFDRPGSAQNLLNPPLAAIDRTLRQIDEDGDPATSPHAQDGSTWPRYKQGVDRNADGQDDVFEKPYRSALVDTLLGTENGPDMRIDWANATARTFLQNLSTALMSSTYPAANASVKARITRIDVYAPPYVNVGGTWTRYGMGTVKVMAQIYKTVGGNDVVLGERMIKAVLNETPYPGPFGPLHSCDTLTWNGEFTVHWGAASAVANGTLTNNHAKVAASIPREVPVSQRLDRLWGYFDGPSFDQYKAQVEGGNMLIEDPWLRYLGGAGVTNTPVCGGPATPNQSCPFNWDTATYPPLGDGQIPYHVGGTDGSHSNVFRNMPVVACPDFDYEIWKEIATSGGSDVHYFAWDNGDMFSENGFGAPQSFESITDYTGAGKEGLYFFDTKDGLPPHDDDADGTYDNLTPPIAISGGTWGVRGFVYLNTEEFKTSGVTGRSVTMRTPGEPFVDADDDGEYDAGERYINLNFNSLAAITDPIRASATDDYGNVGLGPVRNDAGPPIVTDAVLWGVLYTSGGFDATGNANYYGSVVSKSGVGEYNPSAGTPNIYWDESIVKDWPPSSWDLPRVVITRWETDL